MGETVNFYGYDSKWVLVGKDGKFGFVPRKYLSSDTYAELKAEDSGAAVADLEKALLSLGYLDGAVGNAYTSLTTEAVKRMQTACGMNSTGNADVGTLRVLYSGNAPASPLLSLSLSKGTKGDNVKRIQTRLNSLGYLSSASSIDSDYGNTTANAISLFQKAAGGTATGTADNATIRALYSASAPTLPSGMTAADATVTSSGSSGNTTSMGNLASTTDKLVAGMSNAQKLEYVIYIAQQQLGKKYVFGSAGTSTFDCSGLTMYCFKQIGVSLRHSAYSEGYNDNNKKISSVSGLRRGDLVFFNTMSDGDLCDHVGIYLGNNQFIHASSGAAKVVVSNLGSGYYNRVFSWGRRILDI
jgi:cell wall-associated NlpC family hydrolase